MKKIIFIIFIILISGGIYLSNSGTSDIYHKVIRFHVIANSDTVQDQGLKLKIRDKILEYIGPKLKNSKSIEESRNILKENDNEIVAIAENVVKQNGYSYKVNSSLIRENFPIKTYGNITLPQGNYEAYKIVIGKGQGQNWWCVMFPPLCFIDVTKGAVAYKETEEKMKMVLNNKEFSEINNNIKFKFKILEVFEQLKQRTSN
ncbi:MAG: stage II sporulation protein R [Solirubrobacterales bacterium]